MLIQLSPVVSGLNAHARRCIVSCSRQASSFTDINFDLVVLIKQGAGAQRTIEWCDAEGLAHQVLEAGNSTVRTALQAFMLGPHEGLCLVDERRFLYPCATARLAGHLRQFKGTDLLATIAVDIISASKLEDSDCRLAENRYAKCWSSHHADLGYRIGPATHPTIGGVTGFSSVGPHIYYSRRFASSASEGPDLGGLEEVKIELEALRLHQLGKAAFWMALLSDYLVEDWTAPTESPCVEEDVDAAVQHLESILRSMPAHRSSAEELPVAFPSLQLSFRDKMEHIRSQVV